jgi:hypothetical protein
LSETKLYSAPFIMRIMNRANFANPIVDFSSPDFGKVKAKLVAYNGREVQYGENPPSSLRARAAAATGSNQKRFPAPSDH